MIDLVIETQDGSVLRGTVEVSHDGKTIVQADGDWGHLTGKKITTLYRFLKVITGFSGQEAAHKRFINLALDDKKFSRGQLHGR